MAAAEPIVEEALADAAAQRTVNLALVETTETVEAVEAVEAVEEVELVEAAGAIALLETVGAILVLLVVFWPSPLGDGTLKYTPGPRPPQAPGPELMQCKAARAKPVPEKPEIPDPIRRKEDQKRWQQQWEQRCNKLAQEIDELLNRKRSKPKEGTSGLKERYQDMICSKHDPNTPEGSAIWDGHKKPWREQQNGLAERIDEFNKWCEWEGDAPEGVDEFKTKPFPDKSEWRGNSPECKEYRANKSKSQKS